MRASHRCAVFALPLLVAAFRASGFAEPEEYAAELVFPLHPQHNHAPGIAEAADGTLLVSWYRGSGERSADDVAVYGARRRPQEARWSEAFLMADTPGFPDGNTALHVDGDGRLWLFWPLVLANTWESCLTQYRVAKDWLGDGAPRWDWQGSIPLRPERYVEDLERGFEHWKTLAGARALPFLARLEAEKKRLDDKLYHRLGWQTRCKPTVLPSGRILLPLYTDTVSASIMALSDDSGRTWRASRVLAGIGNIQPAVLRRKDGTLLAYMRENGLLDKIRVAESKDDGETWGPVGALELPNPGSGLDGVVLRSGRWVLIHNDTTSGRNSLALSVSEDEGSTWKTLRHLERHDKGSYHYPAIIQGRDGTIHAVYSFFVEGGKSMKHAAFSEAWMLRGDGKTALGTWKEALRQDPSWYGSDEAQRVAENVLLHQRRSGGWPKNVELAKSLNAEERAAVAAAAGKGDATIDNGATWRELEFLARVHSATGRTELGPALEKGLDALLGLQHENGGFRQRFKRDTSYARHITFNDDALTGVLRLLLGVSRGQAPFAFAGAEQRARCAAAFERGLACILKCQVRVDGRRSVWAQQHDETTLAPAAARAFEPAALTACESVGLVRLLMEIEKPSPEIVEAVEGAAAWLARVQLRGVRVEERADPSLPGGRDRVVVEDPAAPPLWARLYEIPSLRPIFGDRDGKVHYQLAEISPERRSGYAWHGAWPRVLLEREIPAWRLRVKAAE